MLCICTGPAQGKYLPGPIQFTFWASGVPRLQRSWWENGRKTSIGSRETIESQKVPDASTRFIVPIRGILDRPRNGGLVLQLRKSKPWPRPVLHFGHSGDRGCSKFSKRPGRLHSDRNVQSSTVPCAFNVCGAVCGAIRCVEPHESAGHYRDSRGERKQHNHGAMRVRFFRHRTDCGQWIR